MLSVHLLLGPRRSFPEKQEPFECGEKQIVSPRQRYAVKFYMVAILFVVFDVEAIFFYPWAAVFRELSWFGYGAMLVFAVPLVVGLGYVFSHSVDRVTRGLGRVEHGVAIAAALGLAVMAVVRTVRARRESRRLEQVPPP